MSDWVNTTWRRGNGACKHRWEPSEFGKRYWAPNTYQYQCKRCGAMEMVTLIWEEKR